MASSRQRSWSCSGAGKALLATACVIGALIAPGLPRHATRQAHRPTGRDFAMFLWCHGMSSHSQRQAEPRPFDEVLQCGCVPMTSATAWDLRISLPRAGRRSAGPAACTGAGASRASPHPWCWPRSRMRASRPRVVEEIISATPRRAAIPPASSAWRRACATACRALTVDRQCASGLDAILLGMRAVAWARPSVVVAGGGGIPLDGALARGAAQEPVPDAALHRPGAGGRRGGRHAPLGRRRPRSWPGASASPAHRQDRLRAAAPTSRPSRP